MIDPGFAGSMFHHQSFPKKDKKKTELRESADSIE